MITQNAIFLMVQYVGISENYKFSANTRLTFNENSIYQRPSNSLNTYCH